MKKIKSFWKSFFFELFDISEEGGEDIISSYGKGTRKAIEEAVDVGLFLVFFSLFFSCGMVFPDNTILAIVLGSCLGGVLIKWAVCVFKALSQYKKG